MSRYAGLVVACVLAFVAVGEAHANDVPDAVCGVGVTTPNLPCTLPLLDGGAVPVPFGSAVGFQSAREGQPAMGPDLIAVADDGHWALYDPVHRTVIGRLPGDSGPLKLARVDDLAFTAEGSLLVLDLSARRLGRLSGAGSWGGGGRAPLRNASPSRGDAPSDAADAPAVGGDLAWLPFPGLAPSAGALLVEGTEVALVDPNGNAHPLAVLEGRAALEPVPGGRDRLEAGPELRLLREGTRVWVRVGSGKDADRVTLEVPADTLGVTQFGRWIVLDRGAPGKMTAREARHLDTGRVVGLPLPREQVWRPSDGVGVTPGGALVWIEATHGGAVLHRAQKDAKRDGAGETSGEALRRALPPPHDARGEK